MSSTPEVMLRLQELQELEGLPAESALIENATGGVCKSAHDLVRRPDLFDVVLAATNERLAALPPKKAQCLARHQYEPKCVLDLVDPLAASINTHGRRIGLYTFAGSFVEAIEGPCGSLEFKGLSGELLASKLGTHIQIGATDKNGIFKRESCPRDLRNALLTQAHKAPALRVARVSRTPLLRDGKLYSTPGLNGDTWIVAPQVTLPSPYDKAAAQAALARLHDDWLGEFPFATPLDRTTAVAAVLSMAARSSIRCPAIAITKPSHGAGGSTLTNFLSVVLAGERAMMLNGAATGEEMTKQVDAVQRSAGASLVFDNIPSVAAGFNNEVIAQVISEELRGVRPFHSNSEIVKVENRQAVILNGVNLRLVDDITRRSLGIELDPRMESPEMRAFKRPELIEDALANRAEILADCYTILLAYIASGERMRTRPIVGFESFRALVAAALVWLGLPDVVMSQEKLKADDPATADLRALTGLWLGLFGERPITVVELINGRHGHDLAPDNKERAETRKGLGEWLSRMAQSGQVETKTLGNWLRRHKGRVVGDHQLHQAGIAHGGAAQWQWLRIKEADTATDWIEGTREETKAPKPPLAPTPASVTVPAAWEEERPVKTNGAVHQEDAPAIEFERRVALFKGLRVGDIHLGQITAEGLAAVFPSLAALGNATIEELIAAKSKGKPLTEDGAARLRECARNAKESAA